MINQVREFIQNFDLIKSKDLIIVGLSGGSDSICLLYILNELKSTLNFELIAAHLDHQWRATSSDDVLFCQNFAQKLNIKYIWKKASDIKLKKLPCGTSKEAHGRLLRRQFLEEVLQEYDASSIALAHHRDDQEETFFLRLIRGATISGLACMKAKSGYYIRPFLNISKKEILNFVQEHGLAYIKDETNDLDIFLRNKIRKYVLPELHKIDERFDKNFAKSLFYIQEADDFIEKITTQTFHSISGNKNGKIYLDKEKFLATDKFIKIPILIKWLCQENIQFNPSQSFFNEILRFIEQSGSGKHVLGISWMIVKEKNQLSIFNILI